MLTISDFSLCKFFFLQITFFMVFFAVLMNLCEAYLPVLITRTFRYGKFSCKEESLIQKLEVPKSYFRHFYVTAALTCAPVALYQVVRAYIFQENVSEWVTRLLDLTYGYNRKASVQPLQVLIAVFLLSLQIFRRFYDTHFISVFSKTAMMNLSHYIIGLVYYPAAYLTLLGEAPKFSPIGDTPTIRFSDVGITGVFAVVLFLWGWYHQHVANRILGDLRKNKKGDVVRQNYRIPEGDWFEFLSSPHCSAEIVMYSALTLLLWGHTGWWYVYAWVLSCQIETILLSHWWYKSYFKDFPARRKALIPFIY